MKRLTLFVFVLMVCLSTLSFAQVGLFADVALSKDIFYPPDQVEIWVRGANAGLEMPVDIYLSVRTPDGREVYAPTFTEMGCPWIHNIVLPQGFSMDWTRFYTFTLPSVGFPLATPGHYVISLWLCATGTENRLTLGSSQQFTIAPCDRQTWVNDNLICSLDLGENGVWAGLSHGVEFIPYDNPIRMMRKGEDGVNTTRTYLFRAFADTLVAAGGADIGISALYPYGWRRMLNSPGTFGYTYGVHVSVMDRDGALWLCHKWPSYMSNEGELVRCWSNGYIENHTQDVGGMARYVVMTNEGKACAIGKDGLYVSEGDSFDFHEIEQFATEATILVGCAHGDMRGNVWMTVYVNYVPYLYKYQMGTGEMTVYAYGEPPIGNTYIDAMTSDPAGNVWFAQRGSGLLEYDGTDFVAFPLRILSMCIAVGFDNTIYCGTYGDGIQVLKDGMWQSYKNPNPEVDGDHNFLLGLPEGRAIAAYNTGAPGYAALEGGVWRTVSGDWCSKTHLYGLSEGKTGLWAWSTLSNQAFHETDSGWVDTTEGCTLKPFGYPICVLEDDQGNPYMLMSQTLMAFADGTWSTIDTPAPEGLLGYYGLWIDHDGNMYLYDTGPDSGVAIQRRSPDGNWTRIDDTNLLPAKPQTMTVSESGLLYVCCNDDEGGWYLTVIDHDQATSYSLNELDILIGGVWDVVSDLADRAWIIAKAPDLSGRVIIYDPASEEFSQIRWESGLLPFKSFYNYAIENGGVDRSMSQLGTLWTGSTPARLNLAPRTELLLDKAAYSYGEAMRVAAYFANQAGSIPIDWYAAAEDANGNLFYWPTYTQAKTPAFQGLFVPTDTALILQLDNILIPGDVPPGHYRWKTGFTRAGQETWLGLGFTATAEFDITAKP